MKKETVETLKKMKYEEFLQKIYTLIEFITQSSLIKSAFNILIVR